VSIGYSVSNPPSSYEVRIDAGGQSVVGTGASGTVTTQPLLSDTQVTCELWDTAAGTSVARSTVTVTVPTPAMTCTVSPSPAFRGDTVTVSWTVTNPPAGSLEANVLAGPDQVPGSSKEVNASATSGSVTHVPTADTTYRCALFSGGQPLVPPVEATTTVQVQALPAGPAGGTVAYGDIMGNGAQAPFQGVTLSAGQAPTGWTLAWSKGGRAVVPPPSQQCGTTESYTPLWVRGSLSVAGTKTVVVAPPCAIPAPSVAGAVITEGARSTAREMLAARQGESEGQSKGEGREAAKGERRKRK
jgi:hypothetical protein